MKNNVIVFLTDQQRYDTVGKYGNPADLTPNLDEYAENGTLCRFAFTPQPLCGPARACIQTGLYANQTGCWRNGIPITNRPNKTLAEYFKEAGYKTGYIGKWHLGSQGIVHEEERGGYEYWLASNLLEYTSDAYDLVMYDNDNQPVKVPGYRVDGVVDRALQYINENQGEPFFLFVSLLEPHCQNYSYSYPAPQFYEKRYIGKWMPPDLAALQGTAWQHIAGYMGMVKRIDEAFGRMMDALKSLKLLDDTIVLFTSDHGDHFMTRNPTNKMQPHESSIRIPMVFCGSGFDRGIVVNELVSLIDIVPTLLDAAEIPVPEGLPGNSIYRLINNKPMKWPEEVLIQTSQAELGRGIRTKKWKYSVTARECNGLKEQCSMVYYETCLYDMENDPYELMNLISFKEYDDIKSQLRTRLINKIVESGEEEPTIIPAANKENKPIGILHQMFVPAANVTENLYDPLRYSIKSKLREH